MSLKLQERTHVADAGTGRRHGRVKRVIRPTKDQVVAALFGAEEATTRYVVEWSDKSTTEHTDAELTARFTSQSKDYGKVF